MLCQVGSTEDCAAVVRLLDALLFQKIAEAMHAYSSLQGQNDDTTDSVCLASGCYQQWNCMPNAE